MSYREQASRGGTNAAGTARKFPLRDVVKREPIGNYTFATLACGHGYPDYDHRKPKRRRCQQCTPFVRAMAAIDNGLLD